MKKYNTFKSKWIILGLITLILLFLFAVKFVYPFLGAKLNSINKDIGTAVVTISCSDSNTVQRSSTSLTPPSENILPGDTVIASTTIKNTGECDIYCLFKIEISISGDSIPDVEIINKYYTYNGSTYIELTKSGSDYNEGAYLLQQNSQFSVTIPVTFNGELFGNDYKNSTFSYTVTALGIQKSNIATAVAATNEIMKFI